MELKYITDISNINVHVIPTNPMFCYVVVTDEFDHENVRSVGPLLRTQACDMLELVFGLETAQAHDTTLDEILREVRVIR